MKKGISVCMLVKDEAQFLEAMLESVYELADEICVALDCNSSDNSREILEACDKVAIHDYKYSGEFDFSGARNWIGKKANCSWTFVIDADELFEETEQFRTREFVLNQPLDSIGWIDCYQSKQGIVLNRLNMMRFYPTRKGMKWKGKTHNQPTFDRNAFTDFTVHNASISHPGFEDKKKMQERVDRTAAKLEPILERIESGESEMEDYYNAFKMLNMVGRSEEVLEMVDEALNMFSLMERDDQIRYRQLFFIILHTKSILNDWDDYTNIIKAREYLFGESMDTCFYRFVYEYSFGLLISAMCSAVKYFETMKVEQLRTDNVQNTYMFRQYVAEKMEYIEYAISQGYDI